MPRWRCGRTAATWSPSTTSTWGQMHSTPMSAGLVRTGRLWMPVMSSSTLPSRVTLRLRPSPAWGSTRPGITWWCGSRIPRTPVVRESCRSGSWRMGRCSTVPKPLSTQQHQTISSQRWCQWSMAGPTTGSTWSAGKACRTEVPSECTTGSSPRSPAGQRPVARSRSTRRPPVPRNLCRFRSTWPGIWSPGSRMGRPESPNFGSGSSLRRRWSHSRRHPSRLPMRQGLCRSPSPGPGPRTS